MAADPCGRVAEVREELDWLLSVEDEACRLTDLYEAGELPLRVTHNDTKINNVLFDEETLKPLVVIDLDTVDNSQINVLTQRTMHRICTAATNEEVSFAYRVAIPRQRFRWRNAFSTRWRSL